jgi:hypothetical protein
MNKQDGKIDKIAPGLPSQQQKEAASKSHSGEVEAQEELQDAENRKRGKYKQYEDVLQ